MKRFFFFLIICISTLQATGQKTIQLKQVRLPYAPKNYCITDVIDDRSDKSSVAKIKGDKTEKADLPGGAGEAIKSYLAKNVAQDRSKQPITLHITKFYFDIKKTGAQWASDAEVTITFYAGDRKLVELSGKGQKTNMNDPLEYVDEFTKKALENDLKNFDNWWQQNKDRVPTATTVKVIANVSKAVSKPDYIPYSTSRPLSIADFQGTPQGYVIELAATLSGIGMESDGQTKNGQMVITLNFTPYFSRSGSWFKNEGKNPRVLAHEQTHFDITAIKACELVNKIRSMTFTQDNYEAMIQNMMKQNSAAANEEEALFDSETAHGTIREKEEEWEKKVKERIKTVGCY
jgi:hypothetical protein